MPRKKPKQIEPVTSVPEQQSPETGAGSAGQSGDLQGLPGTAESASESVRELIEEGQFFEASVVDGVENAPPADTGPIKVRQRPEDDLPPEYRDHDADEPKE